MKKLQNQTVVVPFDFSPHSEASLKTVLEWSDDTTKIHLIHVVEPTSIVIDVNPPVWMPENFDAQRRDSKKYKLNERFQEMEAITIHCMLGDPGSEIVDLAKQTKADVIVMPTHGRTGLKRLFYGSVAERVLRFSECPVYVLKGLDVETQENKSKESTVGVQ